MQETGASGWEVVREGRGLGICAPLLCLKLLNKSVALQLNYLGTSLVRKTVTFKFHPIVVHDHKPSTQRL